MGGVPFDNLLLVCAAAFAVPLLLGFFPRVRVPAVVLEIVAGIVLGPSVLGWVEVDDTVRVVATLGLAFLLFLAGLEIDLRRLAGRTGLLAVGGFGVSLAVALGCGLVLDAAGLFGAPLFLSVALTATALGIVVPVLKDAGEVDSTFGQLVIAGGSVADVGAIVLLTLLFSRDASEPQARVALLVGFALLVLALGIAMAGAGRLPRLSSVLVRLQDTTAQIRVRAAIVLLVGVAALADRLGLETILGAFVAGAMLGVVDSDRGMTHPRFREKLEAIGYGVFVPVFFVTSGVRFDLDALTGNGTALALVPVLLVALALARGLPAIVYRGRLGRPRLVAAGLLQATSLSFLVAAAQIAVELGLVDGAEAAALVGAGLLSVLIFPAAALGLLDATAGASPGTRR